MSDIKMRHITFNFSLLMQETSTSSNTLMHFLRTHTKKNPLNAIVLLFNSMLSIITIAYHNTIFTNFARKVYSIHNTYNGSICFLNFRANILFIGWTILHSIVILFYDKCILQIQPAKFDSSRTLLNCIKVRHIIRIIFVFEGYFDGEVRLGNFFWKWACTNLMRFHNSITYWYHLYILFTHFTNLEEKRKWQIKLFFSHLKLDTFVITSTEPKHIIKLIA